MSTILIFGSRGMLGRYISSYFNGYKLIKIDRKILDIYQAIKNNTINTYIKDLITVQKPDVIINCAGVTNKRDVSLGEMYAVNSLFPVILDSIAYSINAKINIVYPTTDCIYSGKDGMYSKFHKCDCEDNYGLSKMFGENTINTCIIRASIIGEEIRGDSLLEWVRSNKGNRINGYVNHFWNGITCLEYAKLVKELVVNNTFWKGVKHVVSSFGEKEYITKYELVNLISEIYELNVTVIPIETQTKNDRSLLYDIKTKDIREQIIEMKQYNINQYS